MNENERIMEAQDVIAESLESLVQGSHPSIGGVLKYFRFKHLPPHLAAMSSRFAWLAADVAAAGGDGPETTVALRKLLEGKDAAVRALVR